jgi:hypothetical protein
VEQDYKAFLLSNGEEQNNPSNSRMVGKPVANPPVSIRQLPIRNFRFDTSGLAVANSSVSLANPMRGRDFEVSAHVEPMKYASQSTGNHYVSAQRRIWPGKQDFANSEDFSCKPHRCRRAYA